MTQCVTFDRVGSIVIEMLDRTYCWHWCRAQVIGVGANGGVGQGSWAGTVDAPDATRPHILPRGAHTKGHASDVFAGKEGT